MPEVVLKLPAPTPKNSVMMLENTMNRALELSNKHRMIAGVCGGIANWLGWDPTAVRVLYVVVSILSAGFPGTLAYLVLWAVMPRSDEY